MDRGAWYWKFNNSLLTDKDFVDLVKNTIQEMVKMYAASPSLPSSLKDIHLRDMQFTVNN